MSRQCEEIKEAKEVAEGALSEVQLQLQKSKEELEEQKQIVSLLNYRLKVVAEKFEAEKQKGVTVLSEMQKDYDFITSQLETLRNEKGALQETLRKTCEELEIVMSEKETLAITEKDLLEKNQWLEKAIEGHQEEVFSLKQQQLTSWDELDNLKKEQEVLICQESKFNQKIAQLESSRQAQEEELEKLKKESEGTIFELNLRIVAEKAKVEEMVQKVEELEKCRACAEMQILEVKRDVEGMRGECHAERAERSRLQSENQKLGMLLHAAEAKLGNAMERLLSNSLGDVAGRLHSCMVGPDGDISRVSNGLQLERSEAQLEKVSLGY